MRPNPSSKAIIGSQPSRRPEIEAVERGDVGVVEREPDMSRQVHQILTAPGDQIVVVDDLVAARRQSVDQRRLEKRHAKFDRPPRPPEKTDKRPSVVPNTTLRARHG